MTILLKDFAGAGSKLLISAVDSVKWNWLKVGLDDSPFGFGILRPQAYDDMSQQREIDIDFRLVQGTRTVSGTGNVKQQMDDIDELMQAQAGSYMLVVEYGGDPSPGSYVVTVGGTSGGVAFKSCTLNQAGGNPWINGTLKFVEVDTVF